mgnify:CR=1 FL=1
MNNKTLSIFNFQFIIFLFLFLPFFSFSQEINKANAFKDKKRVLDKNNVYLELLGSGYYYSINYERLIVASKAVAFFGRGGIEYLFFKGMDKVVHFPLAVNMLIGKKKHFLEMGAGALLRLDFSGDAVGDGYYLTTPPTRIIFTPVLGYRFMSARNSYGETVMVRVMATPLIGMNVFDNTPNIIPSFGLSIGKTW